MDYEQLKQEYIDYVERQQQIRIDNKYYGGGDGFSGMITPENFAYFIAGLPIKDREVTHYRFTGLWDTFYRPSLEKARKQEYGEGYHLVYGGYTHDNGTLLSQSSLLVINNDKSMLISRENSSKENLRITQICEDGVYLFQYTTIIWNDTPWSFEFYSNEEFKASAEKYNLSIEEIKRRFASKYGYDVKPTKVWHTPESTLFQKGTAQQIPCTAPTLNTENRYMIANKLFREGLDKVFNSGHLEITPEERQMYEEQAKLKEKEVEVQAQPVVQEQAESKRHSLLSEEELQKLSLLKQLKEMGVELSEEQLKELETLQAEADKYTKLREYQATREEREEHIREVMAERAEENEERNARWMEGERSHQEKEARQKGVIEKMQQETTLLEQLKQVMPLSEMQEVILRLNKIYLQAVGEAQQKIELQRMTEEQKNQISEDLGYFYSQQK